MWVEPLGLSRIVTGVANRQASATFCCDGLGVLMVVTPLTGASRLRGSAPPEEFSFPPDAGSCGLSIAFHGGGISPPHSKAACSLC